MATGPLNFWLTSCMYSPLLVNYLITYLLIKLCVEQPHETALGNSKSYRILKLGYWFKRSSNYSKWNGGVASGRVCNQHGYPIQFLPRHFLFVHICTCILSIHTVFKLERPKYEDHAVLAGTCISHQRGALALNATTGLVLFTLSIYYDDILTKRVCLGGGPAGATVSAVSV